RVRDEDIVSALLEQTLEPGRVRTRLDRDPVARRALEPTLEAVGRRLDRRLLDHDSVGVEHADLALLVADVDPHCRDRRLWSTLPHGQPPLLTSFRARPLEVVIDTPQDGGWPSHSICAQRGSSPITSTSAR